MEFEIANVGNFKLLKLTGIIDWKKAKELDIALNKLIDKGNLNLVIDINEVVFFCSGSLGALMYCYSIINQMNGKLCLLFSAKYIKNLFKTVSFDLIFKGCIFKSLEDFKEKVIDKK
ncbi:MAG: STAS domain-containing protein [Chitinispirillia bacterium]|jgi:anti-anti-sigma factor